MDLNMDTTNNITNNTMIDGLTDSQYDGLLIFDGIMGFFSILSSITILVTYILIRESRIYTFRLILYLIFADAIFASSNILNPIKILFFGSSPNQYTLCEIEGFLRQFGTIGTFLFSDAISFILCKTITDNTSKDISNDIAKSEIKMLILVVLTTLVFTIVPSFLKDYGSFGLWCNMIPENYTNIFEFSIFGIFPFVASFIFIIICFILSIVKVNQHLKENPRIMTLMFRLFIYPMIFMATWLVAWIDSYYLILTSQYSLALLVIHILLTHGQGLWITIYFMYDKQIEIQKLVRRGFSKNRTINIETLEMLNNQNNF